MCLLLQVVSHGHVLSSKQLIGRVTASIATLVVFSICSNETCFIERLLLAVMNLCFHAFTLSASLLDIFVMSLDFTQQHTFSNAFSNPQHLIIMQK